MSNSDDKQVESRIPNMVNIVIMPQGVRTTASDEDGDVLYRTAEEMGPNDVTLSLLTAFTLLGSLGCRDKRIPFIQPPPMPRSVDDPWFDPVANPVLDKPIGGDPREVRLGIHEGCEVRNSGLEE